MKIWTIIAAVLFLALSISSVALADEYIRGYYRQDGTYVAPHYRSSPDSNPYNNFSYPGNTNPYTGKVAPGNPESYLQRYNQPSNNPYNSNPYQSPYRPNAK
jgi:hypothetical protein